MNFTDEDRELAMRVLTDLDEGREGRETKAQLRMVISLLAATMSNGLSEKRALGQERLIDIIDQTAYYTRRRGIGLHREQIVSCALDTLHTAGLCSDEDFEALNPLRARKALSKRPRWAPNRGNDPV